MAADKPYRRLPLRELLTDAGKRARDLSEQVGNHLMARAADLRELSRPVRRRSHYPTLLALVNSLQKLFEAQGETEEMADYLMRELDEIREHAKRERLNRKL
jgi:C4-dicarboxylate-specific signal transduction histidine kinase